MRRKRTGLRNKPALPPVGSLWVDKTTNKMCKVSKVAVTYKHMGILKYVVDVGAYLNMDVNQFNTEFEKPSEERLSMYLLGRIEL